MTHFFAFIKLFVYNLSSSTVLQVIYLFRFISISVIPFVLISEINKLKKKEDNSDNCFYFKQYYTMYIHNGYPFSSFADLYLNDEKKPHNIDKLEKNQ